MKDEPLWVKGCPLCEIFLNPVDNIHTKLHYPENISDIKDSEFVILNCDTCKLPMVIHKDHVTSITRESWGRLLYICKKTFGSRIKIRNSPKIISDHFHCHIIKNDKF